MALSVALQPGRDLPLRKRYATFAPIDRALKTALTERLDAPFWFDTTRYPAYVDIRVKVNGASCASSPPATAPSPPRATSSSCGCRSPRPC